MSLRPRSFAFTLLIAALAALPLAMTIFATASAVTWLLFVRPATRAAASPR
ncbi:MAG: hypothetical protein ACLPGW_03565 [Roseiarcus sp.]